MKTLLTFALVLLTSAALAAPHGMGLYVYDGDTFKLAGISYRMAGIDAPEIGWRARCKKEERKAITSRNRLRALMMSGEYRFEKAPGRDKYGRTLIVLRLASGVSVNEQLVSEGLAVVYTGRGKRQRWC